MTWSMSSSTLLTPGEVEHLREAVSVGFENAALGLSGMVNKPIKVISPALRIVPVEQVPNLFGKADDVVVAMYLEVSGDIAGHILLILSLEAADQLVTMLVGVEMASTETLGEMERSALGEVANVTGSFFLNALGDATGLLMQPSPPAVLMDMAGAALDAPLMALALSMNEVLVIDTWFIDEERQIKGLFLILPNSDSLGTIVERLN